MSASEAAVKAVMGTLGCAAGTVICRFHREYLIGGRCPVATAAADAAVDTDRASIQAIALRAASNDIQALHPGETKNSVIWLRERATRIEASS